MTRATQSDWDFSSSVVKATEGTSLDELQNYLQNPTGENAINPQNPFFQQNQMASPSNPWMNPNLPGAFNNPGNLQVNPNLPGAQNNPANPEFNPSLPGAQSNPGFEGRNPGLPGSMTNPGNLTLNPNLPGSITNPANPMHGVLPRPDLVGAPPDPMPPGATFAPRPTMASRLNATMTPNQQQRMREQLVEQYGPEQTNVVHTFPDQWTLHHLPTWNEVGREGEMMHHCWAGMEGDEPYPGDKSYMAMSLRDPNGWPHLSFDYSPEDKVPYSFGEHGGYEPDLESPRWQYIQDWMKSQGEHWPLPLDEYDNPSSAKVSANLGWEPGNYGKGLITPLGGPVLWPTDNHQYPHHYDMIQRMGYPGDYDSPDYNSAYEPRGAFYVNPDGTFKTIPIEREVTPGQWQRGDRSELANQFAKAHPALVPDENLVQPWYQMSSQGRIGAAGLDDDLVDYAIRDSKIRP